MRTAGRRKSGCCRQRRSETGLIGTDRSRHIEIGSAAGRTFDAGPVTRSTAVVPGGIKASRGTGRTVDGGPADIGDLVVLRGWCRGRGHRHR